MTGIFAGIIPLLCFYLLLLAGTYAIFKGLIKKDKKIILLIFITAIVIRITFHLAFNMALASNTLYFPDAMTYDEQGAGFAAGVDESSFFRFRKFSHYTGTLYLVFGHFTTIPEVINIFLGASICVLIFLITRELFDKKTAVIAGFLSILYPSLALFSTQILKDIPVIFLTVLSFYVFTRYPKKVSSMLFISLMILLITWMRKYSAVVLAAALIFSFLVLYFKDIYRVLLSKKSKKYLLPCVCLILGTFLVFHFTGVTGFLYTQSRFLEKPEKQILDKRIEKVTERVIKKSKEKDSKLKELPIFERINQIKNQGMSTGRTAYFTGNIDSVRGMLKSIPKGALYFFFSPFPWKASRLDEYLFSVETILWYALIPFIIYGLYDFMRNKKTLPLWLYAGALTVFYSIFAGNVGTIVRWRMQVFVILLIIAAIGINKAINKLQEKGWLKQKYST